MSVEWSWPWAALLLLGAGHGVNPAMGWLFAVALGLQEGKARAVWKALGPLALGHAAAVAVFVAAARLAGMVLPHDVVRLVVAGSLLVMGCFRLVRHRHPRYGGMRVSQLQLTIWSFLMASAHGAGLMVVPFVMNDASHAHAHGARMLEAGMPLTQMPVVGGTVTHTAAYLAVTGAIALVVYQKVGLKLLRSVWINLDVIWAAALLTTALLMLLL
ncbi:MAG TPA: hypothetical protein VFO52_05440 [Longimicrobiales bacterium]|nr:hypothetical protein [Longimicrobiales bacterium]